MISYPLGNCRLKHDMIPSIDSTSEVIFSSNNFISVGHRFSPVRGIKQVWFPRYQKIHPQINILKSVHKKLHK